MKKFMALGSLFLIVVSGCGGGGGVTPPDSTVSVNTLDGATGVPVDAVFKHTFAKTADPSTVTSSTYFILPTPALAADISKRAYDPAICDTKAALAASLGCADPAACTLKPDAILESHTAYTICLTNDIQFHSGTAFEGFMAQFTTGSCQTGQREVSFTNSTGQPIWIGIAAGTISCQSDEDCPTEASGSCVGANPAAGVAGTCGCAGDAGTCGSISTCNTNNNFCYWNLPSLTAAQINLADGGHSTVCFPAVTSGNIQWSGNIFARTGCDEKGQKCQTGDCNADSSGICPTGTGGNPPATLFEFTFSKQQSFPAPGPDFYDISIINGINVGISAGPVTGSYVADASDPYSCTTPGSTAAQGSLAGCPWTITPTVSGTDQSIYLRDVLPSTFSGTGSCPNSATPNSLGYCECSANADCTPGGLLCGFAMNASAGNQYTNVCGTHIGWWTADQLCGSSINVSPLGAPFNCASTVTNSDASTSTYTNFFICTQPAGTANPLQAQSCYTNGAVVDCCGCATSAANPLSTDWPAPSPGFGGSDNGCYNNNTNWATIVQPWLVYLKQACPTAYTYPFDDATSTFTCAGSSSSGAPNYHVTFLPTN